MLLTFDPTKVRFQKVKIKRVTTALGGSVSILDEAHFDKTGKERFHKIDIPMSLARMFKVKYKITQFMIPHEGVLMWYDDKVITIEKAIENVRTIEDFEGNRVVWTSNTERHYNQIQPLLTSTDWYFDGLYAYRFENGIKQALKEGTVLDDNGMFRGVKVIAYHLTYLNFVSPLLENRSCVAMVIDDNTYSISAPIWKSLDAKAALTNDDGGDDEGNEKLSLISSFKGIDKSVSINLNFALRAAKDLADQFGYESIQPLQLPQMMIKLNTVNLPRMPKEVKKTTDIGLNFTHGLAWLLGLQHKAKTPQQYHTIRQLTKYLMTKGFFWKEKTNKKNLVKAGVKNLPLFHVEGDLLTKVE